MSTKKFAFVLGRERELCLAELKAVLTRFCFDFSILSVSDNVVFINLNNVPADAASRLIDTLGGTVKIFETIDVRKKEPEIADFVRERRIDGKINFGISSYTKPWNSGRVNAFGLNVKKYLKKDLSVRFVALRDSAELSTIVSAKQHIDFEFGFFDDSVGLLAAINNPEPWGKRDYEKPAGDKYSGMLPPKLARIMINLAASKLTEVIVDPFCGSGNILAEALLLGFGAYGSDNSEKAVADSKVNLEWLIQEFKVKSEKFEVAQADATSEDLIRNLRSNIKNYDRIAIVCEPYLGEPKKFKPSNNAVRGEYRKVKELYLSFLKNFTSMKKGGPLVFCIVFPLIETIEGKRFSLYRDSVDEIKKIGYTEAQSPLVYGRDYQVVKREISLLTLK